MPPWPDAGWLRDHWPLPGPLELADVGSGLRVVDAAGHAWHLKRREPGRLAGELFVLRRLASVGVPVTVPAPTLTGRTDAERGDASYWLYPEVAGTPIGQRPQAADAGTRADWRRLGVAAAALQQRLRLLDPDDAELRGVPVRHGSVTPAPTGVQVIHGDMHAGNVLFAAGGDLAGYLDFDHLTIGPRLVDPCYASGALLARLMEVEPDVDQRWLDLTAQLFSGWSATWRASGQPVTPEEADAVPATFVEIESDFRDWLVATGDSAGVTLTDAMVEVIDRRADDLVALAHAAG